ncbi:MAG: M28 family peptidase, partial [Cyclobacteriaceae bacterium]
AAGTHHYPQFKALLIAVNQNSKVQLSLGHDSPDLVYNDWTYSSDHGPFHRVGIPFLYFGVEDHADYHKPTDDVSKIEPSFLEGTVTLILDVVRKIDEQK